MPLSLRIQKTVAFPPSCPCLRTTNSLPHQNGAALALFTLIKYNKNRSHSQLMPGEPAYALLYARRHDCCASAVITQCASQAYAPSKLPTIQMLCRKTPGHHSTGTTALL